MRRQSNQAPSSLAPGGQTEVAQSVRQPSRSPDASPTPILRLRVDKTTKQVTTADSPKAKAAAEAEGEEEAPKAEAEAFVLKQESSTARMEDHGDHVEVWDRNDSGLSWGEKRAKDGSWSEKWMQQESKGRDGKRTLFGRRTGFDAEKQQRWTERWRREGGVLRLVRETEKLSEDGEVLEEWSEVVEVDEAAGREEVTKRGRDRTTGREWTEATRRRRVEGQDVGDVAEPDRDEQGRGWVEEFEGEFEEREGGEVRKKRTKQGADGMRRTEVVVSVECQGGGREEWTDAWYENAEGSKWGEKQGTNTRGERWNERWFEREGGEREVDKWATAADGNHEWGEKAGRASNGEEYNERWERTVRAADDGGGWSWFLDKWWRHPERGSWGRKAHDQCKPRTVTAPAEADADGEGAVGGYVLSCEREEWYDNGGERVNDQWTEETECTGLLPQPAVPETEAKPEATADATTTSTVPLRKVKTGRKRGDRYSDGTEWGENWFEEHRPATAHTKTDAEEVPTDASASFRPPPGSQPPASLLRLRVRHWDKWWKEPTGNRWGEKLYEDLESGGERHEKWYDNGFERQVDRWELRPDGSKSGEKFGSKEDGTRWEERWGREADGQADWIDKSWTVHADGAAHHWGEQQGAEGGRKWFQKWGKNEAHDGTGGREWRERTEEDAEGNTTTEKEGTQWRPGGEVVDWFRDRFGEFRAEKWAHKEGRNAGGDNWTEKWNERPGLKTAEKSGSNTRGDLWSERWREEVTERGPVKWAEKKGENAQGERWYETWLEENEAKKQAKKAGRNAEGGEWEEQWGEDLKLDGSGEKWTSKWAADGRGNRWGNNWGDNWGPGGQGGRRWVEYWSNDDVQKWYHDTEGRPLH